MKFRLIPELARAAEDGGGSGAGTAGATGSAPAGGATTSGAPGSSDPAAGQAPAGAAAAGSGAPGTTADPAATVAAPALYRFEGLPDHLYGKSDQETIANIGKAYLGAREAISKQGEVPKDVSGYAFQATEKLGAYAEGLTNDPLFGASKDIALKHGLSTKQFQGFMSDVMEAMVDQSLVLEPFSADKERAAMFPEISDPKARNAAADQLSRQNAALVDAWKQQGMPEPAAALLASQLDRASGNALVDWIRQSRQEQRPALGGSQAGAATQTELNARVADPRNITSSSKFDPAFAAETTALFKQVYGE